MAVESVGRLLKLADQANTAIFAFDCSDYNMAVSYTHLTLPTTYSV